MKFDDDGDAEADIRSERRAKLEKESRHFEFVSERLQIEGPIEVNGSTYFEVWYFDEVLQKVCKTNRTIAPSNNKVTDLEKENAIWALVRNRQYELKKLGIDD